MNVYKDKKILIFGLGLNQGGLGSAKFFAQNGAKVRMTDLENAGKDVVLAGNIGKSVLDTINFIKEDTLVVLEISSFQLESFASHQVSPKWAVITNITPDHLNYYSNLEQYVEAKK